MPEMRMNSLKSRAMNCGPLSEMMRGFASEYFSLARRRLGKCAYLNRHVESKSSSLVISHLVP
jgi:hypothetical protein